MAGSADCRVSGAVRAVLCRDRFGSVAALYPPHFIGLEHKTPRCPDDSSARFCGVDFVDQHAGPGARIHDGAPRAKKVGPQLAGVSSFDDEEVGQCP